MPSRVFVMRCRCESRTFSIPSRALTGAVPNTRVRCPMPSEVASSNGGRPFESTSCIGAMICVESRLSAQ